MITLRKQHWRNEKYRDSGVEWLGKIPKEWELKKLKYVAEIILGKMLQPNGSKDDVLKPYLRAQNIRWLTMDLSDVKEMWFSPRELNKFRISSGDLLVSEGGEVGRTSIWNGEIDECYFQNSINKVDLSDGLVPRYVLYLFMAYGGLKGFEQIVNTVSIAHLTREKLKEIPVVMPDSDTQSSIASYLDEKCALIDETIAKKQRQIELLKEKRAAIINRAVTRGIDPIESLREGIVGCEKHLKTGERNLTSKLCQKIGELEQGYDCDIELEKETRERPDIVVHRCGTDDDNHLAIEVKIGASKSEAQSDVDKLKRLMLDSYHYQYALFVDYGTTDLSVLDFGRVGCIQINNGSIAFYKEPEPEMKESGVEWIEKIPETWHIQRLRYSSNKIGSGKTPKGGATTYVDTGVHFLRSQNIHLRNIDFHRHDSILSFYN